jgi:hypothetical protein
MLNRIKVLSLVLLLVIGLTTYVHRSTSKASAINSTFGGSLKNFERANLSVRRGNSQAEDGKVDYVGDDFVQSTSGNLYPFSAIVTAHGSKEALTIEIR